MARVSRRVPQNVALNKTLKDDDPEIHALIESEKRRQFVGLELIASEVRGLPRGRACARA